LKEERSMKKCEDIMDRIAESNRSVITGIDGREIEHWITIHVMGKAYEVPAGLTIMQAMEYAGYQFIRSAGCRAGFCGACATIYRKEKDYKLQTALACQTMAESGMYLVQIPFTPGEKAVHDIGRERYEVSTFFKNYPEIARCVACNTCTKACPQDLEVMDYVQAAIRGDFQAVAAGSFDCIQCGLCALRCPAEIVQYHVAQLGRRMYGRYGCPAPDHLRERMKEMEQCKFDRELDELVKAGREELACRYKERDMDL